VACNAASAVASVGITERDQIKTFERPRPDNRVIATCAIRGRWAGFDSTRTL
jgi:hypothetical protein